MEMDPLDMLKQIANSSLIKYDPEGVQKVIKEIIIAWENERGSHESSIDILQDEIVELNKQANDLAEYHAEKIYKQITGGEDSDD